MHARLESREFKVVGIKHTGPFAAYPTLVPQAARALHACALAIPFRTDVEVTLYEPKRGPEHLEGSFYTGVVVTAEPDSLPEEMEFLTVTGTYAIARGDEGRMGEIYRFLDRWIVEQGHEKEWEKGPYLEVYDTAGSTDVEVWLPLKLVSSN